MNTHTDGSSPVPTRTEGMLVEGYVPLECPMCGSKDNVSLRPLPVEIPPALPALENILAAEILAELQRARSKFPGDNVTTLALVEEVGELAKATFEESRARVRKEAVQVATMAMRVVLDGDQTLDAWRASKGLDPLTERHPTEQVKS